MLLHSLKMTNVLSFGPDSPALELGPLNVLIGPNGSGKSNLLDGIALLQAAPKDMVSVIREGGGVRDWLWKGASGTPTASVEAVVDNPKGSMPLRHVLSFTESALRFQLVNERIENQNPHPGEGEPDFYYRHGPSTPILNVKGQKQKLRDTLDLEQSILSQRKDPAQYPEITYLGEIYARIRFYREWSMGRQTPPRLPQKPDLPNDILTTDGQNLGMVLNRLRREPAAKKRILETLRDFYEGIDDYDVSIEGGTVQLFLQEGRMTIPATRLSDGTLRFLCLLAILCHPTPPPLICIEEPELGFHPDVLNTLAQLMIEASDRTQLVVTTHSDILIDALSDMPEAVIVCEKVGDSTQTKRLDRKELDDWLKRYSLGEIWRMGEIGGKRW
ncbi:MAG: AAA family ATPase [Phycisphaerales bacterium]|nr:AAA family ATPase [Phycisphaerales bacterium]